MEWWYHLSGSGDFEGQRPRFGGRGRGFNGPRGQIGPRGGIGPRGAAPRGPSAGPPSLLDLKIERPRPKQEEQEDEEPEYYQKNERHQERNKSMERQSLLDISGEEERMPTRSGSQVNQRGNRWGDNMRYEEDENVGPQSRRGNNFQDQMFERGRPDQHPYGRQEEQSFTSNQPMGFRRNGQDSEGGKQQGYGDRTGHGQNQKEQHNYDHG